METGKVSWKLDLKLTHHQPCLSSSIGQIKAHGHFQSQEPRKYSPSTAEEHLNFSKHIVTKKKKMKTRNTINNSIFYSLLCFLIWEQCLTHSRYSLNFCWMNGWVNVWLSREVLHFLRFIVVERCKWILHAKFSMT